MTPDEGSGPGPAGQPRDAGAGAYRATGVNLEAAAEAVEMIREVAATAANDRVVSGVGGFAGLVSLGDGRLLAAATDGVGTKLEIARLVGRLDTVGIDLVAMSANDVVCTGATPLFFLDYLALGKVVPEEVAAIVAGVAEGCRRAGCALLGGETAEHPGLMEPGRFDLAGFCVGLVEEHDLLDPENVRPGDALIGFASSGLHSNGFSLVRRALLESNPSGLGADVPSLGRTLADELLEPTAIYVRPLLALSRAGLAASAAHITGGGFHENVPRALPMGLGAVIDASTWTPQPIFGLVAEAAGLGTRDLFGVLNMGIGMVVAMSRASVAESIDAAHEAGAFAVQIGEVVEGSGVMFAGQP